MEKLKFLFKWVSLTLLGVILGDALGYSLGLFKSSQTNVLSQLLIGMISGGLVSAGQTFLLRNKLKRPWLWFPTSTLGYALSTPLFAGLGHFGAVIRGLFVGSVQWYPLALSLGVKRAALWIPISGLATGLAGAFIARNPLEPGTALLIWYGSTLISASIRGLGMLVLLTDKKYEQKDMA